MNIRTKQGPALRTSLSLVFVALVMAGCASSKGLNTEGVGIEANSLQTGQSLKGINLSPAACPNLTGGPAWATLSSTL